jgi:hypothetical protein
MAEDMFDWDYIANNCDATPMGLYETTMSAYRGPRTTSIRELANHLANVSFTSENIKQRQAAKFVLLLMTFKLVTRNSDPSEHPDLTQSIRDAWVDFLGPESPNSITEDIDEW